MTAFAFPRAAAVVLALLPAGVPAFAQPAPAFDVAYRAWDIVTDLAKQRHDPAIGGECAKTFRPFVIPGLKQQAKADQDVSARACVAAAKAACTDARLARPPDIARKCEEFR